MLWNREQDPEPELGKFDQILISDCLFFEKFQIDLVYTIRQLSHARTEVLIAAPERGDSMQKFILIAEEYFCVESEPDPVFDAIIREKFIPALPVVQTQDGQAVLSSDSEHQVPKLLKLRLKPLSQV